MRNPKNLQDIIPEYYKNIVDLYIRYSDDIYRILQEYQSIIKYQHISGVPDITEWLKMYNRKNPIVSGIKNLFIELIRRDSRVINAFFSLSKKIQDFDIFACLFGYLLIISAFVSENPYSAFFNKSQKKIIKAKYDEINPSEYDRMPKGSLSETDINYILNSTVIIFLIKVWLPCILFYFTDFKKLYSEAIEGNINSLCKLMLVDKAITYDKKISKVIDNAQQSSDFSDYNRIMDAFKNEVYLPSNRKYKVMFATLVKKLAKYNGYSITYEDLLSYFQQKGGLLGRDARDKDLDHYEDSESFAKEVRRTFDKYVKSRKTGHKGRVLTVREIRNLMGYDLAHEDNSKINPKDSQD